MKRIKKIQLSFIHLYFEMLGYFVFISFLLVDRKYATYILLEFIWYC